MYRLIDFLADLRELIMNHKWKCKKHLFEESIWKQYIKNSRTFEFICKCGE